MNIKFSFYMIFILFIFSRINAFVVEHYDGAIASIASTKKLSVLNKFKKIIEIIEIVYSDGRTQIVYGYAFKDSFIIMSSLLLEKDLAKIKQIKYLYTHQRIIKNFKVLKELGTAKIFSGTSISDISDSKNNTLREYYPYFMRNKMINDHVFNLLYKSFLIFSGDLSQVNSLFQENLWGDGIRDFLNELIDISSVDLYSVSTKENSWFIIGRPNGESTKEIEPIPLNYVSDNISYISIKLNGNLQPKILLSVTGVKFQNYDLGAFIINCRFKTLIIDNQCKFIGQITKIETIKKQKQTIIVEFINNNLFYINKFNLLGKSEDSEDTLIKEDKLLSVDSHVTVKSSMQTSKTPSKIISSSLAGGKELKRHSQERKHKLDPESEEGLEDEGHSQKKKIKPNPSQLNLDLGQLSCDDINSFGKYVLNESVIINVYEVEISLSTAEISGKYNIIGTYKKNGKEFKFNLCYKLGEMYYLTEVPDLYQK